MYADMKRVQWSNDLFTPAQVVNEYKDNLPAIAVIEQGYRGKNENEGLLKGDYVCFSGIGIQKRVIGRDLYKRTFTIPEDYPLNLQMKQATGKFTKAMSMSKILDISTLPVVVRFEERVVNDFYMDEQGSDVKAKNIGEFEIYLVYDEKYLQGAWLGSQYENNYIVLPCDVNLTMRLGTGLIGQSRRDWNTFRDNLGFHGDLLKQPYLQLGFEIVVMNKEINDKEEVYSNVCSSSYGLLRHTEVDRMTTDSGRSSRCSYADSGFQEDFSSANCIRYMQEGKSKRNVSSGGRPEDQHQPDKDIYETLPDDTFENNHSRNSDGVYENLPDSVPVRPPPRKTGPPPHAEVYQRSSSDDVPSTSRACKLQSQHSQFNQLRNASSWSCLSTDPIPQEMTPRPSGYHLHPDSCQPFQNRMNNDSAPSVVVYQRFSGEEYPPSGSTLQPQTQHSQFYQLRSASSWSGLNTEQVPEKMAPGPSSFFLHPDSAATGYVAKRKTSLPVLPNTASVAQKYNMKFTLQNNDVQFNRQRVNEHCPASFAENPETFWTSLKMSNSQSDISHPSAIADYNATKKEFKKEKKDKKNRKK